jgi:hypothetical protein
LCEGMNELAKIPPMVLVKQKFSRPIIFDIQKTVESELDKIFHDRELLTGKRIAITAGSRGISNIAFILRCVAEYVNNSGGKPVVISAMGSHGGGTAEGQQEVLASQGITPENINYPVESSSEVVHLGSVPGHGIPVYCAKEAVEADGVIVVNRIKAHTAFRGQLGSGLAKMIGVGLGRAQGAKVIHSCGPGEMGNIILKLSRVVRSKISILAGLAIVENGYGETALIKAVSPENFEEEETKIYNYAQQFQPSLPFDKLDLLIIDEMGKNFSGTGMDTNIIGRWRIRGVAEPERPDITRILVLNLSEKSYGNATGIGLADFTTKKLVNKIDYRSTYLNCLTSGFIQRAMIPITLDSDQEAIETAINSIKLQGNSSLKIVRIKNTLHLNEIYCSEGLIPDVIASSNLKIVGKPHKLLFDQKGNLIRG